MAESLDNFGFWAVLTEIDWKEETWLIILLCTHLLIAISICTFTKSRNSIQMILFFILLSAVYFSEDINSYAAQNWQLFSTQPYFDSNGLFISIVFSMPILLNCMLLIGLWLYNSTELIQQIKVAQLKRKMRIEEAQKAYKVD